MRSPSRAAVLALAVATPALAAWDCSLSLGSAHLNLAQVDAVHSWETTVQTPPSVTKTRYALSLCSALPDPSSSAPEDDCPHGTRLCMRAFSSRLGLEDRLLSVVPVAGELDGGPAFEPSAKEKDGEKADQAWVLELGGGKYNGVEQRARIEMRCDPNAKETSPTVEDYDSKAGVLSLKWTTFAACPTNSDSRPPPSEGDNKPDDDGGGGSGGRDQDGARDPVGHSGGLGFFGWFLTLLVVAFVAYFAIGSYQNYTTYSATGWDMIPHRDVWRDLPYVVADLFKGRGGSRNGYSALG
ncbi:autophagy-related protein 27 [Rhodotorula paludigena]|uniref:autophagy-related protein 27 n=1 Tax=Rhodotorula paludigena TaxID=86838 RepID=UPI00317E1CB7